MRIEIRYHKTYRLASFLVCLLWLTAGCISTTATPPNAEMEPVDALAATSQPPTATPTPPPTSPPSPTPMPTPTLVPLPQSCLRQNFADDVASCDMAPSYEIDVTVDLDAARLTGRQEIDYTNQEEVPLTEIYLRLLPNARGYGGTMTVINVLLNGQPVSPIFEEEKTALRLPLDSALRPGQMVNLSMDFDVEVPTSGVSGHALFSYLRGVMALPTFYPLIPVYDAAEGWNVDMAPEHGDDVYADVAIYDVRVTAPPDVTLIASGACVGPENGVWTCDAAPMRDFTLILGENYERAARQVGGVVVNSYYYPSHQWGGDKALQVAVDALTAFTELFGPYPYTELDVVETPNHLGGMEYSGLVVVEDGLYTGGGVEWLTAHEVAHQWWMVVVGNDQIDDPWLDEALTQYSTMLYYEQVYGEERAQAILRGEFQQSYQSLVRRGRDMPAGLPAEAYPAELYWDTVYDKGALYFHELRERVGDETFFEILQTYYQRHRYRIATPDSFLAVVEEVSGDAHRDLFETWIAGEQDS